MPDPAKELEQLDKRSERLESDRNDAWDRMDVYKGRLQEIEEHLRADPSPAMRQSLEKEQVSIRIDYIRSDREIHDIDKELLDIGQRYQALDVRAQDNREDLIERRDALIGKFENDRNALTEMRAEGSVIGTKHYLFEMELAQKELSIIAKKLGEPPFMGMSQGSGDGPELDPAMKKGRDFEPEF